MKILAIESSCDETAVSVIETGWHSRVSSIRFKILSSVVSSQVKIHAKWGGVVPSLAKREHQKNLIPVLKKALLESNLLISNHQFSISKQISNSKLHILNSILKKEPELLKKIIPFLEKYKKPKIDFIAVTQGPGLEPALWVGINFARALSVVWDKQLLPINHMEGHLFSVFLQNGKKNLKSQISNLKFPAVSLLASGGHTELILMKDWLKYKKLGQTRDDAAGEAFDKVAKMLGLGYPGGPVIAAQAAKFPISNFQFPINAQFLNEQNINNSLKIKNSELKISFPRPMINSKDYDFSFSGLKTAVLYGIKEMKMNAKNKAMVCSEFQQAVVDVLVAKTKKAAENYSAKTIILAGGVAANGSLREKFKKEFKNYDLKMPLKKFTGDNAAMTALAAVCRYKIKKPAVSRVLKADGNIEIG